MGFGEYINALAILCYLPVPDGRIAPDLVDHRFYAGGVHKLLQLLYVEVGDADAAEFAFLHELIEREPDLGRAFQVHGQSLGLGLGRDSVVYEQHVQIIRAQSPHALAHTVPHALRADIVWRIVRHLAAYEKLIAGNSALLQVFTYSLLVAVSKRGVKKAIAKLYRRIQCGEVVVERIFKLTALTAVVHRTAAYRRHFYPIVQREKLHVCTPPVLICKSYHSANILTSFKAVHRVSACRTVARFFHNGQKNQPTFVKYAQIPRR